MNKPNIFIASSKEALSFAEAVNIKLESIGKIKQWDNAFELSSVTINALIEKTKSCDYAVFVFHNDDKLVLREETYNVVRDNVLFELGLFIGALGLENCFILIPEILEGRFRLPSDLSGVTISTYDNNESPVDSVTSSSAKIKFAIENLEKNKTEKIAEIKKPEKELQEIIVRYQSEIFMNRHEMESLHAKFNNLNSSIISFLQLKLKPATPKEIQLWEQGAKESYLQEIRIMAYNVYYADSDIIVPPLYGAKSLTIIAANGVHVYFSDLGHNKVYFMDGFRKLGL